MYYRRRGEGLAREVKLVDAMAGLLVVGESGLSGPQEYLLLGKSDGLSEKKVGPEDDAGAVVEDLLNLRVECASRLLGKDFGVLATESVTEKYVPVLEHVEEAALVVENTRGWLRPVWEGVGQVPPLRDPARAAPVVVEGALAGGSGEA